jgi:predicted transcriptional regulator
MMGKARSTPVFGPKIKISQELYNRLKEIAEARGYSSAEELAIHILESEVARQESGEDEQLVEERLRGLGYI